MVQIVTRATDWIKIFPLAYIPVGEECAYKLKEKSTCVVVDGVMTVVSLEEDIEDILEDVKEALFEAMGEDEFLDSSLGIVRVSPAKVPIQDEGVQEDIDSSVVNGEDTDIVRPVSDTGSMLGIVSLCGAGALLVVVAASIYRRKRSLKSNDASTLQEGVAMNGLSRFDVTHDDPGIENMDIDYDRYDDPYGSDEEFFAAKGDDEMSTDKENTTCRRRGRISGL